MGTGLGVDPTKDGGGVITSGMTSLDQRKITGSLYTPGVITGCQVTTSASVMQYTIAAGTAVIQTATGQAVVAPVPAVTINTDPAPTSGSPRIDIVYARQHFPADGDSNVIVNVGTSLPANSVELMRFSVGVNITNTNAAVRTGNVAYSVPYGALLPVLHEWTNTFTGTLPNALTRQGHGTIYLPTDRRLKFSITTLLYANGAVGFDNANYCEYYFLPNIDNGDMVIFTSPGLHQAWATYKWDYYINVTAGTHTVNYGQGRMVGPSTAATFYGTDSNGFGRTGTTFRVEDAGIIV